MLTQKVCRIVVDTGYSDDVTENGVNVSDVQDIVTATDSSTMYKVQLSDDIKESPEDNDEKLPSDDLNGLEKQSLRLPPVRSRCRSPVTVQEWVAALPDMQREGEEGEKEDIKGGMDNLSLGAEGINLQHHKNDKDNINDK